MRHRLPLSGSPVSLAEASWEGERQVLPWPAIGIADTARGGAALQFALELAEAAHGARVPVRVSLLDFAQVPQLAPPVRQRFERVAELHGLRVGAGGVAAGADPQVLHLWVGIPAIVALSPALAVLLGAQRPPLEWPTALRGCAARCQLSFAGPPAGMAGALIEELVRRGFLPAG